MFMKRITFALMSIHIFSHFLEHTLLPVPSYDKPHLINAITVVTPWYIELNGIIGLITLYLSILALFILLISWIFNKKTNIK